MIKEIWTDDDFEEMSWYDCRVYGVKLLNEDLELSFDIDYIFKWIKTETRAIGFDVAPCVLTFQNVSGIKIEIAYADNVVCWITDFLRSNVRPSADGKLLVWDYTIGCVGGHISFSSTGFKLTLKSSPVRIEAQDLERKKFVME